MLFVRSMTSPSKETAGIVCPSALFKRVNHRACVSLELVSNPISWYRCDTLSSFSWTAETAELVSCT